MNCAWCGANADGSDSHGICTSCAAEILQQHQERKARRGALSDQLKESSVVYETRNQQKDASQRCRIW
jgi:hypothetical protein